ncbi:hypothetical protein MAR_002335 [Mya arenaria]|uniref:Uncharacterized protein n=1 Tax=Mya arenaria TaxID=6604 RepID=A0ABY7FEE5_MYAAR|nr:hypothetical protein MAR_002335 [Mya arenaria]
MDRYCGIVVNSCNTKEEKHDIMKCKATLKQNATYKNIYIEHDLTPEERKSIANLKTIAKVIGNDKLDVKGNRLLQKTHNEESRDAHEWQEVRHRRKTSPPQVRTRSGRKPSQDVMIPTVLHITMSISRHVTDTRRAIATMHVIQAAATRDIMTVMTEEDTPTVTKVTKVVTEIITVNTRFHAETQLKNDGILNVEGYITWIGQNRTNLHRRAPKGSGGIGDLIRNTFLNTFTVNKFNDEHEGILWLSLANKITKERIRIVYEYQKDSLVVGVFHIRVGNNDDYIAGVDCIPERDIIDYHISPYCDASSKICIKNDNTSISTKGCAVVDYCLVPYKQFNRYEHFSEKINLLEANRDRQKHIDNSYTEFLDILNSHMTTHLNPREINLNVNNTNNKRVNKPWWKKDLSVEWKGVCVSENLWLNCKIRSQKNLLKAIYMNKRKLFDKHIKRRKRAHWHDEQSKLLKACENTNKSDFWKDIGKIGIGSERNKYIPIEVLLADGTVSTSPQDVLNKWKNSFEKLNNVPNINNEPFGIQNNLHETL